LRETVRPRNQKYEVKKPKDTQQPKTKEETGNPFKLQISNNPKRNKEQEKKNHIKKN
jgi:hypothetical protein